MDNDFAKVMDLTMTNDFRVRQVNSKLNKHMFQTAATVFILGGVIGWGIAEIQRLKKEVKEIKEK